MLYFVLGMEPITGAVTTVTPEPGSVANIRSGASVPWALFGVTFVLLLVFGGVLLGFWYVHVH